MPLPQALASQRLSQGPRVEAFEEAFARYTGRSYAVAVSSGTAGLLLALKAYGIGPGDEVLAAAYSWRETAHAIMLAGATPVFVDVDYWSGVMVPGKVALRITPATRAILAGNTNGHPAPWHALARTGYGALAGAARGLERGHRLEYQNRIVGSFGDCAVFDFSQPASLCCGEGGMVVTDDADIARALRSSTRSPSGRARLLRRQRARALSVDNERAVGGRGASCSLRESARFSSSARYIEGVYFEHIKSFEGIKDPYVAPEVDVAHWLLYLVHLGTRFSRSACDAIVEDLRRERIEAYALLPAAAHCSAITWMQDPANRPRQTAVTEKLADRAIALPFHRHLSEEQIAFIVSTLEGCIDERRRRRRDLLTAGSFSIISGESEMPNMTVMPINKTVPAAEGASILQAMLAAANPSAREMRRGGEVRRLPHFRRRGPQGPFEATAHRE